MIVTKATANQLGFAQGYISLYMPACLHGRHNNYSLYGRRLICMISVSFSSHGGYLLYR